MAVRWVNKRDLAMSLLAWLGLFFGAGHHVYGQTLTAPVADSSLGTSVTNSGSQSTITGGFRPNNGANLFHSFQSFDVGAGRTANFVNPGGVLNTIARVTGGNISNINGTVNMNGMSLFLLNPAGVLFGPGGTINTTASVYISTANTLRFADNTVFSASPSSGFSFSSSVPTAFGFSGSGAPAPVAIQGSTITASNGVLMIAAGPIRLQAAHLTAATPVLRSLGSAGEAALPSSGSGVSGTPGSIQATAGTVIEVTPALAQSGITSIQLFPSTVTVPSGATITNTSNQSGGLIGVSVAGGGSFSNDVFGAPVEVFSVNPFAAAQMLQLNQDMVQRVTQNLQTAATVFGPQSLARNTLPCAAERSGQASSLVQGSREVTPPQPGEALWSPVVLEETSAQTSEVPSAVRLAGTVGTRSLPPALLERDLIQPCRS
jgi:filamentous hemagglutinin family protein